MLAVCKSRRQWRLGMQIAGWWYGAGALKAPTGDPPKGSQMHQRDQWGRRGSGEQNDRFEPWGRREAQHQMGSDRDTFRNQARDREFAYGSGSRPEQDQAGNRVSYGDQQGQRDWSPGQHGGQAAGRRRGAEAYRPWSEPSERYGRSAPYDAPGGSAGPAGEQAPREQWARPTEPWGGQRHQNFDYPQRDTLSPDPTWSGRHADQFDPDYHQWRSEQMRALDEDYRSWRQDRYKKFSNEFDQWRSERNRNLTSTGDAGGDAAASTAGTGPDGHNAGSRK
jgi:hypothetical protein